MWIIVQCYEYEQCYAIEEIMFLEQSVEQKIKLYNTHSCK